MPKTIICDRDPIFTSTFWKELFLLQGTYFKFSYAYHPQTDGQTEVMNRMVEMYLWCVIGDKPKEWVRWILWAEYCYNTSVHTSTKKTPYEIVYGRPPPTLLSYVPGATQVESVDKELYDRDQVFKELKNQLQTAQNHMKKFYDAHWTDMSFEVGEFVYLRLQPHRQVSVALCKNVKLSPRYYGSFGIIQKVRTVAYKLNPPSESRIHPVFHISYLKKKVGLTVQVQHELPNVQEEKDDVLAWP
ncbi:hypothetical protein AMTRI_Chr04g245810 [Amborella trichopoda]